jgi:hypothetical protein
LTDWPNLSLIKETLAPKSKQQKSRKIILKNGAHTKRRFTKRRITKHRITKRRMTKRRQDKTSTLQNVDYNKTSTLQNVDMVKAKILYREGEKIREKYDKTTVDAGRLFTILEHIINPLRPGELFFYFLTETCIKI